MHRVEGVFYNWVENHVVDTLPHLKNMCTCDSTMLITVVDSEINLENLTEFKEIVHRSYLPIKFVKGDKSTSVSLEISRIPDLLSKFPNLFNGFDEV